MKLWSIRGKLTISSAIVITAMILLIEVSIYVVAVEQQVKDTGQIYSEMVEAMGKSFDDLHLSFKRGMDFITMNKELQEALAKTVHTKDELGEWNVHLKVLLTDRALLINEIDALYLFDGEEEFRTFWKKKYIPGEAHVPFPQMDPEWFLPSGKVSARMLQDRLVFSRKIRSMENLDSLGYLLAVYDEKELYDRVERVVPNEASSVIVFDAYGNTIAHNYRNEDKLNKVIEEVDFSTLSDYEVIKLNGNGEVIISQYVSEETGWRVVSLADVRYVVRSSLFLRNLVLILGVIGAAGGIAIQWALACRIVKPLNHMVEVVEAADSGNYSRKMEIRTKDELMILSQAFNRMLEKTDVLVNQVLRDEIKFKEAQLALMQAQINPHMLYNTLECINWLAEFDRKDEIRQVTIAFSNLMKSLAQGEKMVRLEEEVAYSADFLSIYQILLEGKMEYQIEMDSRLNPVMIPRLLIQPLVENSVVHGIKKSIHGGKINVTIVPSEKGILISVLDNGIGMSVKQTKNINDFAQCHKGNGGDGGLGIRNIIERLHLVYGNAAKIYVTSEVDWGTTVDLWIPMTQEEGI